tara:strand:+ start:215 stop:436 length:222 start_codon:yes stop_codon:yes gene_type:complete
MKNKIKGFIMGISVILFMGFTGSGSSTCGKYQIIPDCDSGKMIMLDSSTGHLYEYDYSFNHWKKITFGNHIWE